MDGVDYVTGSLLEPGSLALTAQDADVVFESLSPRGELAGRLEGVVEELIRLADEAGVRLGVLGGVSSTLVAEGGPRLFDVSPPAPPEVLPEIQTGLNLLMDENGESYISSSDLALAVLDEIKQPRYRRRRLHVAL